MGSKSKLRPQLQRITIALDLSVRLSGQFMNLEPFPGCTPGGDVGLCAETVGTQTALEMLRSPVNMTKQGERSCLQDCAC